MHVSYTLIWEFYEVFSNLSKYFPIKNYIRNCGSVTSSHPKEFLRKDVPKLCSKCTGEDTCRSVISIKLLIATLLKSHLGIDVLL